ncbi:hypothetical protein ES705_34977 [subsurface metagenome]
MGKLKRVEKDPAVAIILLAIIVVLIWAVGCMSPTNGIGPIDRPSINVKWLQIAYCGCGGEEKLLQDQERDWQLSNLDWEDLCGLNDIVFRSHYTRAFEPTELEDLPIFKIINYTGDATRPEVIKDERPTRAYIDLGVLECLLNWYYWSTLEGYLQEKIAAVGGHAIILMETYEIGRAMATEAGEIAEEAVLMSVKAQVIYFAPERRRWREEWGTP